MVMIVITVMMMVNVNSLYVYFLIWLEMELEMFDDYTLQQNNLFNYSTLVPLFGTIQVVPYNYHVPLFGGQAKHSSPKIQMKA